MSELTCSRGGAGGVEVRLDARRPAPTGGGCRGFLALVAEVAVDSDVAVVAGVTEVFLTILPRDVLADLPRDVGA